MFNWPNQATYWLYKKDELSNRWCSSRIKLPTDFMQKPNFWRIGNSTVVSSNLLTLYRSQIGKSAMQQPNRAGDLLTLYRLTLFRSRIIDELAIPQSYQATYWLYTDNELANRWCSSWIGKVTYWLYTEAKLANRRCSSGIGQVTLCIPTLCRRHHTHFILSRIIL